MSADAARRWWLAHPEEAVKAGLPPDGSLLEWVDRLLDDGLRTCDQCCGSGCTCPCHEARVRELTP